MFASVNVLWLTLSSCHSYRPESEVFTNAPTTWQSNSMQDAALFIVMNLAAMKSSRDAILDLNGVNTLTRITEYNKRIRRDTGDDLTDEQKQLEFQRLKAVSSLYRNGCLLALSLFANGRTISYSEWHLRISLARKGILDSLGVEHRLVVTMNMMILP